MGGGAEKEKKVGGGELPSAKTIRLEKGGVKRGEPKGGKEKRKGTGPRGKGADQLKCSE